MIEIVDVKLSKSTVKTGEQVIITITIEETIDFPFDFPFDFPVSWTGVALPEGAK